MKYFDVNKNGFYEENDENRMEISDELWQNLLDGQSQGGKIEVINGQVVCTMPTAQELELTENNVRKQSLLNQIKEMDEKRIRALAEPSIKDEISGQSWLEYYTQQIIELRTEITEL